MDHHKCPYCRSTNVAGFEVGGMIYRTCRECGTEFDERVQPAPKPASTVPDWMLVVMALAALFLFAVTFYAVWGPK